MDADCDDGAVRAIRYERYGTPDVLGMRNPPALFAASTIIVSAVGTGALALARYVARRR